MAVRAAMHAVQCWTAHLLALTSSAASRLLAYLTSWGVALATLNLAALTAAFHGPQCISITAPRIHHVTSELPSDGCDRSTLDGTWDSVSASEEDPFTEEEHEGEYVQKCPTLADADTTGYVSDEDAEDDAVRKEEGDATQVLQDILPYLQMAVAAYSSTSLSEEFEFIKKSQLISNVIDPTRLFGHVGITDTEVHVCILHDRSVAFAFRGTEPTEWRNGFGDVLTDLAQGQGTLKLYDGSGMPVYTSHHEPHICVHRGFQDALKDVTDTNIPSQNLRLVLQELGMQAQDVGNVVCVGHSLGGALATLCAKWCREVAFPQAKIGCVTIGSPRVGNEAFAIDFNRRVVNGLSYRVVNKRDIVPSIPNLITYPAFGSAYKHVSKPIYLYANEAGGTSVQLGGHRPAVFGLGFFNHRGHSYLDSVDRVLQATTQRS